MSDTVMADASSGDLICPVCDASRDHPQPFQDLTGQWWCGACWFETATLVAMQPKPPEESEPCQNPLPT